jgi:hypothetical protein
MWLELLSPYINTLLIALVRTRAPPIRTSCFLIVNFKITIYMLLTNLHLYHHHHYHHHHHHYHHNVRARVHNTHTRLTSANQRRSRDSQVAFVWELHAVAHIASELLGQWMDASR